MRLQLADHRAALAVAEANRDLVWLPFSSPFSLSSTAIFASSTFWFRLPHPKIQPRTRKISEAVSKTQLFELGKQRIFFRGFYDFLDVPSFALAVARAM